MITGKVYSTSKEIVEDGGRSNQMIERLHTLIKQLLITLIKTMFKDAPPGAMPSHLQLHLNKIAAIA